MSSRDDGDERKDRSRRSSRERRRESRSPSRGDERKHRGTSANRERRSESKSPRPDYGDEDEPPKKEREGRGEAGDVDDGDAIISEVFESSREGVAYLYGRNGATMARLGRFSGAEIKMGDRMDRIDLAGTAEQLDKARLCIKVTDAQRTSRGRGLDFDTIEKREDCSTISVPQMAVGFVMGSRGSTLRDIETRHKAFLFFNNEKVDNNCKTMFILGTTKAREGAVQEIQDAVELKKRSGGAWVPKMNPDGSAGEGSRSGGGGGSARGGGYYNERRDYNSNCGGSSRGGGYHDERGRDSDHGRRRSRSPPRRRSRSPPRRRSRSPHRRPRARSRSRSPTRRQRSRTPPRRASPPARQRSGEGRDGRRERDRDRDRDRDRREYRDDGRHEETKRARSQSPQRRGR